MIIGGHSHTFLDPAVMVTSETNPEGTLIAQAGRYATNLGKVNVGFVDGEIVLREGYLLPAMTQEKLDTQRQVVLNERLQRVDNQPYGRAFERLYELLYESDHPYHWPVLGYPQDLEEASLEDIAGFFSRHYQPRNAVLSLVGDLERQLDSMLDLSDSFEEELVEGRQEMASIVEDLRDKMADRDRELEKLARREAQVRPAMLPVVRQRARQRHEASVPTRCSPTRNSAISPPGAGSR